MGTPNRHKCKPSTEKIPNKQYRRKEIFHFVAGLEGTFLGAELSV